MAMTYLCTDDVRLYRGHGAIPATPKLSPLRIVHDEMRSFTRKQYEALLNASRCEYCGVKRLGGDQRCSGCGNVL